MENKTESKAVHTPGPYDSAYDHIQDLESKLADLLEVAKAALDTIDFIFHHAPNSSAVLRQNGEALRAAIAKATA